MIPFNVPPYVKKTEEYIKDAILRRKISGDGEYTKLCSKWLEEKTGAAKVLLTTSGTHALEMAAMLCGISPGDEVILPSYTFSSTANAFLLNGGTLVFTDIRSDTLNIDENLIEAAITDKTKAIAVVHYAGVSCNMDAINSIAQKHGLSVIEDAAQGVMAKYKGAYLGTLSNYGCYSFHETKNYSMGEGGAIIINDPILAERAEIIREKGTNRSKFFRGEIDKYTWQDKGSSYLPSELNAAYLYAQLEAERDIFKNRMEAWELYYSLLKPIADESLITLPVVPQECSHNAHMFYIKAKNLSERTALINFLKQRGIGAVYHYVPLHSARAGKLYGRFHGQDKNTTRESERIVRLPLYYGISEKDVMFVAKTVGEYYGFKN